MAGKLKRKNRGRVTPGMLSTPGDLNERLLNAILSISGSATLEEALEPLLKAALEITRMEGGGVYWVEGDVAALRHHCGLPEEFVRAVSRMPLAPSLIQTVLRQQEPVEIGVISPVMRRLLSKHGIRHAFSFPLRARGILLGFLNVGTARAEAPEPAGIQALWVLVKEIESLFFRLYTEKALRDSEERQRRLLENLKGSHFIYLHDTQGVFQYLSESVTDILGYTPEEFMAHYSRYLTDHPVNQAVRRHTELSIQGIRQPPYEINLWHKDGSTRWLEVQEVPVLDEAGRVIAVEGVAQDITERKRAEEALRRSEQRLKRSQQIAHLGSWELDLTTNELNWSDEVYRIFGLEPQEFAATYEAFLERVHPDDRRAVDEAYAGSVREGRDVYEIEHRIVRKNTGEVRLVHEKCEHFRAVDGPVVRSIGMVHDITERKRMETLLQQTNERLEEQVQARTEELNHTIDQLQNAMQELEHHAEQLQKLTLEVVQAEDRERKRLAEFLHDDLQQTLAAAKFHLSILGNRIRSDQPALAVLAPIRQMLKDAIEKSRSLSHELGPPVLYHSQLDAVFEWLADQMESRHGLSVQVEVRGHADSNSEPVRSFLYRTAQEILFNTAKHAQVHEAKLRLQRVRDELWLTISDQGRGFDPAALAQTSGFGLSTIRERAHLLGGRMTIKSAPGQGSIFFIVVPDVAV